MASMFHIAPGQSCGSQRRGPARGGFTLVELLVVIGIIALLISILMPSLNRARESAKQLNCLSNLRQLGMAFVMYTNNNKGYFPRVGVQNLREDWIHWEASRDISESAIGPYISSKPVTKEVFRCPSDNVDVRPRDTRPSNQQYKYSYSANYLICKLASPYEYAYTDGTNTLRITEIYNPSSKILLIDESSDTVDDGCWAWMQTFGNGQNVMANRHERNKETIADPNAGRGNANFCDGHAEFIGRRSSFDPYYFDPKRRP